MSKEKVELDGLEIWNELAIEVFCKMLKLKNVHRLGHVDSLHCRIRSFAYLRGRIKLAPRAHRLIGKMLFDPERKVVMDWSGKAGCTIGAMMFFRHMSLLDEALQYNSWIHNYRREVFQQRHLVTVHDLLSRKNVLFKVVRNPYTRIISSLRNKVCVPGKNRKIMDYLQLSSMEAITFRQFVEFLESTDLRSRCDVHYREQVQDYELLNLRRPIICRLENLKEGITQLNNEFGFEFDLEGLSSEHHAKINTEWEGFAGDIPWSELSGGLPEYSRFYDRDLRERVGRLYERDLRVYHYAFPWEQEA